ncbi:CaiB/BaiF CoA transferase family protein [Hydrogenophaga laconesensis]|uniref:Alpha-methylacyl-CoA racemase n=1 Tax=Hydrogenophaga laconesensis TaxID=1805971 RepID=A0ABU1V6W9_9BURK|nr:CaiB/BaiF CoA-transferase family protein [Hydrogenophaga laconesensis]MDR7093083.1 alpha-methylacyl-CoA racemase [Hydrogenophaga laconesensis]
MSGPLHGVTVIELAGIGPGPFAGMMLADMGARVIRVDRIPTPGGGSALEALMRNDSVVDRGRESIALNMKDPRAVDTVLRLVEKADILIEGFRPGVTEKLGVGPQACMARNPKLIYGRMTGWGQSGPLSQAAGHDLNYIALSGAVHAMGPADRPPTVPLNLVGDYGGGGMLLALGVVAALYEARQSGQGQVVDAAISDGAAVLMAAQYGLQAKGFWHNERASNFLDGSAHFYGTYACADGGYLSVGAIEPQFYRLLLEICGLVDAHFAQQWERAEWPALREKLAAMFLSKTRDEWSALLEGTDACVAPVLSMAEAPWHPHNRARGTFVTQGGAVQPAPAPRFERTPSELPPVAPAIGRDSRKWLRLLGRSDAEIEALVAAGVVHEASD